MEFECNDLTACNKNTMKRTIYNRTIKNDSIYMSYEYKKSTYRSCIRINSMGVSFNHQWFIL